MTGVPFSKPPEAVCVGGKDFPVRTDFRAWVQFEQGLFSGADGMELIRIVCPGPIPQGAVGAEGLGDALIWFYHCGDQAVGSAEEGQSGPRPYDYAQDADTILSSFRQVYGIDLSTDVLHWWTFQRLLWGLPSDSPFLRVLDYRTADLSDMGKKQKRHYEKMRRLYALKTPSGKRETLKERDARMLAFVARRFNDMQRR